MNTKKRIKIIYVAGSRYSGSTILSLILGSDKKIFYAGELAFARQADPDFFCVCGKKLSKCPFWSRISKPVLKRFLPSHSSLRLILKILNPFVPLRQINNARNEYDILIKELYDSAKKEKKSIEYILDSSKLLRPLYSLFNAKDIDLYVIHLIRDGVAVADSLKKKGFALRTQPFKWVIHAILRWIALNITLMIFFRRAHIKNIRISYNELCQNSEITFKKINQFLGISLGSGNYRAAVQQESYHNLGGNTRILNKIKVKFSSFDGIKNKDRYDHLSKPELFIARILLSPFNAWFLKG